MKRHISCKTLITVCFLLIYTTSQGSNAFHLKTDLRSNPLGIDNPILRFSWIIESQERGFQQSAFEILVSKDSITLGKGTGNQWQTGKVSSNSTFEVMYNGKNYNH